MVNLFFIVPKTNYFGMKAKKSYGQHFLKSEIISKRIAESLDLPEDCTEVLEIGPGMGMLTKYLLEGDYTLYAVEADDDMVEYVRTNFPELNTRLFAKNVLKLDFWDVTKGQLAIIGNFPYNISSQIIFKMLENKKMIPQLVGMFQKEVAERIVAKHGSKTYGIISVLTQAYYDAEYLFGVKKENFQPPPKVQSAVIRLRRKPSDNLGCDHKLFRRVVKTSFGQRRKMIRNTMKSIVQETSSLDPSFMQKRPEQLSVEDFVTLTNSVAACLGKS